MIDSRRSARIHPMLRSFWLSLRDEVIRLNTARLGWTSLSRLSRRERTRAVKAALTSHHQGPTRCC